MDKEQKTDNNFKEKEIVELFQLDQLSSMEDPLISLLRQAEVLKKLKENNK